MADARFRRIWIQLFLFKMMSGFQSEMSDTNDGQYIYHFVQEQSRNSYSFGNQTTDGNLTNCLTGNSSSSLNEGKAQNEATTINQYSEMISSGISILIMILLGPLTDKIGRKFLLIWNVTMLLIGMTIRICVVFNNLNVYLVLISSVFAGLSGTHYTYDLASSGIMADTTSKTQQRSFVLILYGSVNGIGFLIAQIITGYMINYFGYLPQYFICAGILLILDVAIITLLREQRYSSNKNKDTCCGSLKSQIWSIVTDKEIGNRKHILSWLSVFVVTMFAITAYMPIRNLYMLGSPFCWSSERIGWYGASLAGAQSIFEPLIIGALQHCLPDETVIQFSFISTVVCLIIYGLATKTWMLYTVIGIGVIRYSSMTLIKAILSRKVHPDKQGVLFSNMALIDSAVRVAGVAAFSDIYNHTRNMFKGFVFLTMASVTLLATAMSVFLTCLYGTDPNQRKPIDDMRKEILKHEEVNTINE